MSGIGELLATEVIKGFTVGNALSVGGTIMQLAGAHNQADAMRASAAQNAENMRAAAAANKAQTDYAAGQEEAASQHEAEKERRKSMLMLSRAQAIAAASGAGPVQENLISGIVGEGETAAQHRLYAGTEKAKGLRYRGDIGAYEANAKGRQGIADANAAANATIMGAWGKAGVSAVGGLSRLSPGTPPGGGTAYANRDFDATHGLWEYN